MDAAVSELPQPEKRRSFTAKQRNMIATRQAWLCNVCKKMMSNHAFDIDHIQRLDALGKHEPSNWQALCVPCHAEKTRTDNREAKKGARVRGEKGQRARRERRGGSMIKSASKIQSRGFQKNVRRKMNGIVERIEQ
jgi:5-methylcytosine-specific restriction endonuclease McrA